MKADELMIGDWVEPDQCMIPIVYCKILGIYPDDTVNLDKAERLFTLDELHPIPLTPEILEKNGFVHSTRGSFMESTIGTVHIAWGFYEDCISIFDSSDEGNCQISSLECKYIHQLQHALRLCGIEKEIEL